MTEPLGMTCFLAKRKPNKYKVWKTFVLAVHQSPNVMQGGAVLVPSSLLINLNEDSLYSFNGNQTMNIHPHQKRDLYNVILSIKI